MSNPKLSLSDLEKMELGAKKILDYFDERLKMLRIQNDEFDALPEIRGRIAEIKTLQHILRPKKT